MIRYIGNYSRWYIRMSAPLMQIGIAHALRCIMRIADVTKQIHYTHTVHIMYVCACVCTYVSTQLLLLFVSGNTNPYTYVCMRCTHVRTKQFIHTYKQHRYVHTPVSIHQIVQTMYTYTYIRTYLRTYVRMYI